MIPFVLLVSLLSHVPIAIDHASPCFPVPPNFPAESPCERADSCAAFPIPTPLPLCPLETKVSSAKSTVPQSTTVSTLSSVMPNRPSFETAVFPSETSVALSSTTVNPETTISLPQSAEYSSQKGQVRRRNRIAKRQEVGRVNYGGCPNYLFGRIVGHVVGPLTSNTRMRLGDIAQILQSSLQRATGRSFEVITGKGEMMHATYQRNEYSFCRLRIGDYYTTVYETPVQYDVTYGHEEEILSNIDFGEPLGGSGYPGQVPFPNRIYSPWENLLEGGSLFNERQCFSGDLIVETLEGSKRMNELKTGDEVLSMEEGMGMITFSPIVMFLHRDEQLLAEFNLITTITGNSVKLTNEHFIYVYDCENIRTLRPVRAKEVNTSHCLMITSHSPLVTIDVDRVSHITKVSERGIYSPLTLTGDIIVNGVLASCHSNLAFKTLQQSLFNIYRYIYRSLSFILTDEGQLPIGLSSLLSSIDIFIPEKPAYVQG